MTTPTADAGKRRAMYRRLFAYVRPHWWRMAGNVGSNLLAAGLDVFSFTLLIPFLNALFREPNLLPANAHWVRALQERTVGALLDPANPQRSLGASIQEYVTRDLRDSVFQHMQRLSLRYFQRTKAGQIISKILSDTDQTKA